MRTAVLVFLALLAAACSQDNPERDLAQSGPSQSSTTTDAVPTQMAETNAPATLPTANVEKDEPGSRSPAASPIQEVHLIEYAIHMPDSVPAGRVSFNVENGGKEKHAFEVEGNGVHQKTEELTKGNSASVTLDLKPGTYTVYCPVDGHAGKGMKRTLTVR
jgi:uncharacterized cupredoxin-like copper-binding protein